MKACGAKTRAGGKCKRPGTGAGGRCRLHGGASPVGIASPQYQHGRWSKYVKGDALERYQASVSDSELIALHDDVALLDLRVGDLLGKVHTGESSQQWMKVRRAFEDFRSANAKEDVDAAKKALTELGSLIQKGAAEAQSWNEISNLLERRRRLVDTERRRLVEIQAMIPKDRAAALFAALSNSVKKYVSDPATLRSIATEFRRLTGSDGGSNADHGRADAVDGSQPFGGQPQPLAPL